MKPLNKVNAFLQKNVTSAGVAFHEEISTEENKDYRRGFRAGVFFAFLQMKSDIGSMDDAAAEQPTD